MVSSGSVHFNVLLRLEITLKNLKVVFSQNSQTVYTIEQMKLI